jgi:beta-mannosidase
VRKPALTAVDVGIAPRAARDWTEEHVDPFEVLDATGCRFDVWVASSGLERVELEVVVRFISVASGEEVAEKITSKVIAEANATTEVLTDQRIKLCTGDSQDNHDPFIIHAVLRSNDGQILATDTDWPQPLKYLDFSNRNVKVEVSASGESITVSANRLVKGLVFEEREGLTLSDNGFDIVPGEERVVHVVWGSAGRGSLEWTYLGFERTGAETS